MPDFVPIYLGVVDNDGTGTPAKTAGDRINNGFTNIQNRATTLETSQAAQDVTLANHGTRITTLESAPSGGSSNFTFKTGNFNFAAGDKIAANTTSSAFTGTLPASPAAGDTIEILDPLGTWPTNNLTIAGNGKLVAGGTNLICDVANSKLSITYIDSTVGWKVFVYVTAGGSTKILQVAYADSVTSTGITTPRIPYDNTIPQITEGTEILTCSITPKSATSYLLIEASINYSTGSTSCSPCLALFRDATANALDARLFSHDNTASNGILSLRLRVAASSVTTTTFRLRASQDSGTLTVNPTYFGGVNRSVMTVTEITP